MSALHEAARRVVAAWVSTRPAWIDQCNEAVLALDAALKAQPEPAQEPVAWMRPDNRVAEESYSRTQFSRGRDKPPIGTWTPLYTAPPQRRLLTDEEIEDIFKHLCSTVGASYKTMARAIERNVRGETE